MNSYSAASLDKLETCHEELIAVCRAVIPVYDHTIIWGLRNEEQQNALYPVYTTKLWPDSRHNSKDPEGLSNAVDMAPWHSRLPHIRWENEREFVFLAGHVMLAAAAIGVKLRWGGDWDEDKDLYDINKPFDLGHFERIS